MIENLPIYDWSMPPDLRKLFRSPGNVIHRSMCPVCGKRNVNVYRYGREWLCRICRDAAEKIDETLAER